MMEKDALAVLESRLKRIYRSFDFREGEDIRDRLATNASATWKITGLELLEEKRIGLSAKRDAGVATFIRADCHSGPLAPKPRTAIFLFLASHL
jgi:hypothetical protein